MKKHFLPRSLLGLLLFTYASLSSLPATECQTLNPKMDNIMESLKNSTNEDPLKLGFEDLNTLLETLDHGNKDIISAFSSLINDPQLSHESKEKSTSALSKFLHTVNAIKNAKEESVSTDDEGLRKTPLDSTSRFRILENDVDTTKTPSEASESSHISPLTGSAQNAQVSQQGAASTGAIFIVVLIVLGLMGYVVMLVIKKRKRGANKQSKIEKQKFIPRLQISVDAPFEESKNRLNGIFGKKKMPTSRSMHTNGQNIFTPNQKTNQALNLEDNHQSSIINDNLFTNIDNSPRSQGDEKESPSTRQTPKDIGFNIEFSMLEQNSKIHSARD